MIRTGFVLESKLDQNNILDGTLVFSSPKNKIVFDSWNAAQALHFLSHFIPLYNNDLLFYLNTINYHRHLISLWFPSICHNDNGCFTLYWRLLTVDFHLCTMPMGSILNNDRRILSRWTRNPLLIKKPLRILISIPGCSSHACLVSSSS